MDQTSVDLSGLRDLHIPTEPNFWPPAYGWWVILLAVIGAFILGGILFHIWHNLPVVYALRKLNKITAHQTNDLEYLKQISMLFKRVAIAVYGRATVAPLSDQKWQDFLLASAQNTLTEQQAHLLAFALYEPNTKLKLDRLIFAQNAANWIKKVFKNKKSS